MRPFPRYPTVGNGDIDIVEGTDGRTWLAIAAQGRVDDPVRDFKRIYVMALPPKKTLSEVTERFKWWTTGIEPATPCVQSRCSPN